MEPHKDNDDAAQVRSNIDLRSLANTLQSFDNQQLGALLDLSKTRNDQLSTNQPVGEEQLHQLGAFDDSKDHLMSASGPPSISANGSLYLESNKSRLDALLQSKSEHRVQINKSQLEDLATLCQDRLRNNEPRALVVAKYLGQTHPNESWSSKLERAAMAIMGLESKEDALMDVFHHCRKWNASRLIEVYRPRTSANREMEDTSKSRQMVCNIFRGVIDARNQRLATPEGDLSLSSEEPESTEDSIASIQKPIDEESDPEEFGPRSKRIQR